MLRLENNLRITCTSQRIMAEMLESGKAEGGTRNRYKNVKNIPSKAGLESCLTCLLP